jgi:hypothetical protein
MDGGTVVSDMDPAAKAELVGIEMARRASQKPQRKFRLVEPVVPDEVIYAFHEKHGDYLDLSEFDGEWGNTNRFKHSHIQAMWEGWRDSWLKHHPV